MVHPVVVCWGALRVGGDAMTARETALQHALRVAHEELGKNDSAEWNRLMERVAVHLAAPAYVTDRHRLLASQILAAIFGSR